MDTTDDMSAGAATKQQLSKARAPRLPGTNYHRLRKAIHLGCVVVFILLPLSNLMRFDIPRQRFYFFGAELGISEFGIIFFSLMFLMFLVAATAMVYGRIYCGYLCPQMIFSEAAVEFESWIGRRINQRLGWAGAATREVMASALMWTVLLSASVVLSFVFISYFVEPRDLLRRLLSLDIRTAGGIAGATTTLLTLLDFAFLRQRFCTTVCPYGYLQGILSDKNTLLVEYRDPGDDCIHCSKCVRVCPMDIDIRHSAHQIECTHCGECIDACSDVLGRLGKHSLIHYAWGEHGQLVQEERSWRRRLGLRDGKRYVILLVLLFYASGLYVAIAMRHPVFVRIAPDRATLFEVGKDGMISNRFRLQADNRTTQPATVTLQIDGLRGARFAEIEPSFVLPAGGAIQHEFRIAAPASNLVPGVNRFRVRSHAGNKTDDFPMTFIAPETDKGRN